MDIFTSFLMLLGGVGGFLIGVKLLSDNMEKLATGKIKQLFSKTAKNKIIGLGIGAGTTAIIQSSGATTVMIVGLVNAGAITLYQATTMIMGANIGTTVTAFISALSAFKILKYSMYALTFIGVFMTMLTSKEKIKTIGNALAGLGLIFVGLEFMKDAIVSDSINTALENLLAVLKNPFLLVLIGIVITTLTQSSSVLTSVLVVMAGAGLVVGGGGNSVLFIILGTNIGSTTTALISSIGSTTNGKRASLIHLLFNTLGSIIFFIVFILWPGFMDSTFGTWFASTPEMQIAMFHTFFNVICTLIFVPFVSVFVFLANNIIRDKENEQQEESFMDKRFLSTPAVAITLITRQAMKMLNDSVENCKLALTGFIEKDDSVIEKVLKNNEKINRESKEVTNYLILVSSKNLATTEEKYISAMHHTMGDVVRIAELSDNITKYLRRTIKEDLVFGNLVKEELKEMFSLIEELSTLTQKFFDNKDMALVNRANEVEEQIDLMRKKLVKEHIARLNCGECRAENSSVFINLVCNLERVGDHIDYIIHSTIE